MVLKWILIPPHPLNNFEIQRYYQNEPKFNGIYSRDNLLSNLDEYADAGTQ